MWRVVVDTNIFISATFWKGKPRQVIDIFTDRRAVLVLTADILQELERKLSHRKFAAVLANTGLTVEAIVSNIRDLAEIVLPSEVPEDAIRDRKDRIILACAVGGNADSIVSGDQDLTILKSYRDITIVTPTEFLSMMIPPAPDDPSIESDT